ncbi:MAG TPA: polyketide antibiotic transporter [Pseudonocardiaceae bacterium]|nr:polyketide antibiotic transporter [Pseudonocardiaceae bacterium]
MTTGALDRTPSLVVTSAPQRVGPALTGLACRHIRRGAAVVFVVAAGMSAVVATQYQSTFAGALDGPALQALAANPAIRTLFGSPVALDDPGGFTVWRTGTPLAVLIGVWALLTATRVTRGEEDAGRWDLLLAGRVRSADLVVRSFTMLAGAVVVVGAGVAAALVVAGTAATGAVLHGAGLAGLGLIFAAMGGFAAQIMPTRASATGLSVAVLGTTLLMRMVADGIAALTWLHWVSPFGLLAKLQPYAAERPGPLLILAAVPLLLGAGAVLAARCRDVGSGLLSVSTSRRPRIRLLGSVTAFAVRRTIRPWTGWALGVSAYYLLIGLLAVSITEFLTDNARFAELAAEAGFAGLGSVPGYAATMFSLLGIPAGVYAAARITAAGADEISRHTVLLFGLPVSRRQLAGAEILVTVAGVLLLLASAGVAVWVGTAAAGAPLGVGAALAGALNVTPVALLCLGAAVLALGWAPRAVLAVGALPAVGGFLLQVTAQSVGAPEWVGRLSPFAHLALVPETPPDWGAMAGLSAVAVVLMIIGVCGYARRDLAI